MSEKRLIETPEIVRLLLVKFEDVISNKKLSGLLVQEQELSALLNYILTLEGLAIEVEMEMEEEE